MRRAARAPRRAVVSARRSASHGGARGGASLEAHALSWAFAVRESWQGAGGTGERGTGERPSGSSVARLCSASREHGGRGAVWRASPGDTAACQADEERRPGARWLHWRGYCLRPLARPQAAIRQQGRAVGRGQEGLPERSSTVWRTYERTATHARYVIISACVTWLRGEELCVPGREGNSGRRAAGAPASRGLI